MSQIEYTFEELIDLTEAREVQEVVREIRLRRIEALQKLGFVQKEGYWVAEIDPRDVEVDLGRDTKVTVVARVQDITVDEDGRKAKNVVKIYIPDVDLKPEECRRISIALAKKLFFRKVKLISEEFIGPTAYEVVRTPETLREGKIKLKDREKATTGKERTADMLMEMTYVVNLSSGDFPSVLLISEGFCG